MTDNNLIFDVGMHAGQDTAFYLAKGFRVVAVEANPLLAREAETRFHQDIDDGRLTVLNTGVGDRQAVLPFYINAQYSEWSSFDKEIGSRGDCKDIISVPMLPFEKLFETHGVPYYLKIDIEGYDFIVLQRLGLIQDHPIYVSLENGFPYMVEYLVSLGYSAFKFINQAEVPSMHCPSPSKEGKSIPWSFPFGASGPFGEDTPGDWKRETDIMKDIRTYWDNPDRDPNIHGWYDLHARLG
jgi:methyltransferase, FkbM family